MNVSIKPLKKRRFKYQILMKGGFLQTPILYKREDKKIMRNKKSIAILMILCLVLMNFSYEIIIKADSVSYVGNGTVNNPYLISTVEEFNNIRNQRDSCYRLTEDIDFNGATLAPIGSLAVPFKGSLDGDGHTIKNFKIDTTISYTGLFGYAASAKFKNLVLENAEIKQTATLSYIGAFAGYLNGCTTENVKMVDVTVTGGDYCGTLAGYANEGTITACSVIGTGAINGITNVGGLVGYLYSTSVRSCFSTVEVKGSGNYYVGGLIGAVSGYNMTYGPMLVKINECYATGNVTGKGDVGGLIGKASYAALSNSFAIGSVTSTTNNSATAGLVGETSYGNIKNCYAAGKVVSTAGSGLVGALRSTTVENSYFDMVATGIINSNTYNVGKLTTILLNQAFYTSWDFVDTWEMTEGNTYPYLKKVEKPAMVECDLSSFPAGEGTETSPYLISNANQFNNIRYYNLSSYYKLVDDIDFKGETLIPIGTSNTQFKGSIDGDGHTLQNFIINATDDNTGIFRYGNKAKFKNFTIENAEIKQNTLRYYIGALAGALYDCTTENIRLIDVTVTGGQYCGAIAGNATYGSITDCSVSGNGAITGTEKVGGMVGVTSYCTIQNSFATVAVNGGDYVGGLLGQIMDTSDAKVTMNECYATGAVTGRSCIGGLAGYASSAQIKDCFAMGSVSSTTNSSGTAGLVGYSRYTTTKNCYSVGKVASTAGSGFIYDYLATTVKDSYFDNMASGITTCNTYNVGKMTSVLMKRNFYVNWDFTNIWDITDGRSYPYLRNVEKPEMKENDISSHPAGVGTEGEPYLISNTEHLQFIKYDLNGHYKLTEDLDFNGETVIPIGTLNMPFKGSFDGGGHTIRNFKITTTDSHTGLFRYATSAKFNDLVIENAEIKQPATDYYIGALAGYLDNCTTENISLINTTVTGGGYCGTLAGYAYSGSITGCSVTGNGMITGKSWVGGMTGVTNFCAIQNSFATAVVNGGDYTGGLIGQIRGSSASKAALMNECYATGNVTGKGNIGGLTGEASYANISDCFANGSVTSTTNSDKVAGLIGYANYATVKNCYSTGKVVSTAGSGFIYVYAGTTVTNSYFDSIASGVTTYNTNNVGKVTRVLMKQNFYTDWNFADIWDIAEGSSYPYLRKLGKPELQDNDVSSHPAGDGTESFPYLIRNAEQFQFIKYDLNSHYKLTEDIDFNGETLIPIGTSSMPFRGSLDGAGHTMRNFRISTTDSYTGMFRYAISARFKDLVIEKAEVGQLTTTAYLGVLAGYLNNCITEDISLVDVTVTGGQYCGALAGYATGGNIVECSVAGDGMVNGTTNVGGLLGYISSSMVKNCFATVKVKGSGDYAGGMVGVATGTSSSPMKISECYATENITGKGYVGGLIGSASYTELSDSFATGSVTSTANSAYAAGLIGYSSYGSVKKCYSAGSVISTAGSGLVYVYTGTTVINSYFDSTAANKSTPATQARTTEQMFNIETFAGWDFENIWWVDDNSYPTLKNFKAFILSVPIKLTYSNLTNHSVIIEWAAIQGATEYEVSYLDKIEKTATPKMTLEDLTANTVYEFKVRAKVGDKTGVWSQTLKVRIKGKSSTIDGLHCINKDKNSITLTWNEVEEAEGYEVIYNKKILMTESNTCTITGLHANTPYTIYVKAVTTDGSRIISNTITEKIYTLTPQTEYAKAFIEKCEGQTWFIDEMEKILNIKGKSINTIKSRSDFSTIYVIALSNRGISGKIPVAIGELYNLKYLYLANNNLSGKLPKELDSLSKLKKIDLSNNNFSD